MSPPAPRRLTRAQRLEIIGRKLDLVGGLGLEIGPSHNPLLRKVEGYNVRIADHLDQAGLMGKYAQKGTDRIERVDYVLGPGRMTESISDRFDYIVASHVAEHTVCLISFLQDCEQLLQPGGTLSLALPDMRYCFDRLRERASLGRVIDVHHAAPAVHTPGMVTEHFLCQSSRDDAATWFRGAPGGTYRLTFSVWEAQRNAGVAAEGNYVDTHNWVLTPHHFRLLVHDLRTLGYISLHETDFTDTIDHEFFIALSPTPPDRQAPTRDELAELSARDLVGLEQPHLV